MLALAMTPCYHPCSACRILNEQPEMQKLFPSFASVPVGQLEKNKNFLAQSYIFQCGLSFLIDNIDDNQLMVSQVAKVASSSYFVFGRSIVKQIDASVFCFSCFRQLPVVFNSIQFNLMNEFEF